jgi:hypothetical protein
MGLRVRLKANVNISGLPYQARIVAQALKTYGMILADNGSPWYISGAPNAPVEQQRAAPARRAHRARLRGRRHGVAAPSGRVRQAQLLLLGAISIAIGLLSDGAWAIASGTARTWLGRSQRRLEQLSVAGGMTLIGLGAALAVTGRRQ